MRRKLIRTWGTRGSSVRFERKPASLAHLRPEDYPSKRRTDFPRLTRSSVRAGFFAAEFDFFRRRVTTTLRQDCSVPMSARLGSDSYLLSVRFHVDIPGKRESVTLG